MAPESHGAKGLAIALLLGLAFFALARLTQQGLTGSYGFAVLWPPAGLAAGALAIAAPSLRPLLLVGIALGSAAANAWQGFSWPIIALYTLANCAGPYLFARLLPFLSPGGTSLRAPSEVAQFVIAAALGCAAAATILTIGHNLLGLGFGFRAWQLLFLAHLTGVISFAPVFLTYQRSGRWNPRRAEFRLDLLAVIASGLIVYLLLGTGLFQGTLASQMPFIMLLPIALWVGITRSRQGAAWAGAVAAFCITLGAITRSSLFSGFEAAEAASRSQILTIAFVLTLLTLTATRSQMRRSAAALQANEERLQLAVQAGGAATWDLDLRTLRNIWSDNHFEMMGLSPTPDRTVAPEVWRNAIPPEDNAQMMAEWNRAAAANDLFRSVHRLRRADGTIIWAKALGRFQYEKDRPVRFVGVTYDITAERDTLAALSASEGRLKLALEGTSDGVWDWNLESGEVFHSPRWIEMLGYTPDRWASTVQNWMDHLHPADVGWVDELLQRVFADPGLEYAPVYRMCHADGSWRWMLSRAQVVRNAQGRAIRMVGAHTDITQQQQTEQRQALLLKLAEQSHGSPLDTLKAAINLLSRHTGAARVGYAEFSPDLAEVHVLHELCAPGLRSMVGQTFTGRALAADLASGETRTLYDVTTDARFPAHEAFLVFGTRSRVTVPILREGRVSAALYLNDDAPRHWTADEVTLTEEVARRTAAALAQSRAEHALASREAELRRLNETLEARVESEVAAREQVQARLSHAQRMEALGQLAGGIAHDFNNVLQAVGGGARLIARATDNPAKVERLARMMSEAVDRGASVTGRLLAFSRRADLRAEPVRLGELLPELAEILTHTLGAGVAIHVQAPVGLPPVTADKSQLESALINLSVNARDAMEGQGSLTLTAETESLGAGESSPGAGGLAPGAYVRITVADTGSGMDTATLARASEPFFTTKPVGRGTGLGLSMARGFAEQSDGALHIESTPGAGTRVSIWLPVAQAAPEPAPAPAPEADAPGGSRAHILLVDDDALVREVTAQGLEQAGYAITTASGGEFALDLLRQESFLQPGSGFDMMITDLSMPGMDGLQLIRAARDIRPDLPVLLLTGFPTHAAELALGDASTGRLGILRKPIAIPDLDARIGGLLAL